MAQAEPPQLYLITPPEIELASFLQQLKDMLDAHPITCLRLALASTDEDHVSRAADACREITHARDVALVIENHLQMVEQLGLDGVHLRDGARSVRAARKALGPDAIVGSFCGTSRHDGMSAGEAGADYISFGPVGHSLLGDGAQAAPALFEWWTQMIELPVVAEGALTADMLRVLSPITDFVAIGDEIWQSEDPVAALADLRAALV